MNPPLRIFLKIYKIYGRTDPDYHRCKKILTTSNYTAGENYVAILFGGYYIPYPTHTTAKVLYNFQMLADVMPDVVKVKVESIYDTENISWLYDKNCVYLYPEQFKVERVINKI